MTHYLVDSSTLCDLCVCFLCLLQNPNLSQAASSVSWHLDVHLVKCVWPARLLHDASICEDFHPFVCICWGRFTLAQPDQPATVFLSFLSLCVLFSQRSLPPAVSICASVSLPLCICLAHLAPDLLSSIPLISRCLNLSQPVSINRNVFKSSRWSSQVNVRSCKWSHMCNVSYDSK